MRKELALLTSDVVEWFVMKKDGLVMIRRWVATQLVEEARKYKVTPFEVINRTACRERFLARLRRECNVGEDLLTSALGIAQTIMRRKETDREASLHTGSLYLPEGWEVEADKCRVQPCKCLDEIEASCR